MAVAELDREAFGRQNKSFLLGRLDLDARIGHEVEPGRMGRGQMIIIDAVLDHELPVGGNVVFLHAGNDLHPSGRRLVDDEVDVVLRRPEIIVEGNGVLVEA